jgi:hypothetical protein
VSSLCRTALTYCRGSERFLFVRSALLIACLALAACGGGDEFIAPPAVVAYVDVKPQRVTNVALWWRVQLSATARDSGGSAIPGAAFQWSSSADSVATVDRSGIVTAVGNGAADIEATADGATGVATVIVQQEGAYLEFVSPPTATIVGHAIAPVMEVAIKDLGGTTVSDATDSVTIAIGANPGSAVLGGTTTVGAVGGVASFSDLTIDEGGRGYTLVANASRLYRGISAAFDVWSSMARIDSVKLLWYPGSYPPRPADELYVDRFRVDYAVSVSSIADTTLSAVTLQSYIDQGSASRAAGQTAVVCTSVVGDLPQGTCAFNLIVGASNTAAGSGTLVQGDATARFELRDISNTLLDSLTRPLSLVETAEPPLPRVRIDSLSLSSTALDIGGTRVDYTATLVNEESDTLSEFGIQGWIDQGFVARAAGGGLVRCSSAVGDLPPGRCASEFTVGVSSWRGVPGPAIARFELRDYAHERVVDTFFVPVTLHW